jgi:hypothetical protein
MYVPDDALLLFTANFSDSVTATNFGSIAVSRHCISAFDDVRDLGRFHGSDRAILI